MAQGWVALLRAVNLGTRNKVPMARLREVLEDAGYESVATYIQSGNVLFSAPSSGQGALTDRIERLIRAAFEHYDASVVVRSRSQMRAIVDGRPKGFGSEPTVYRYDVCFLKPGTTARQVISGLPLKEGVDRIWPGAGVVYFSRLTSRATQSRLNRVAALPVYKQMTIRNWNTTTKLADLLAT